MKKQLKRGDLVQFHTPYPSEVGVRFIVLAAYYDVERPRAEISMLDSGMTFAPRQTVNVVELEVVRDGEVVMKLVEKYRATKDLSDG